jgi:hypothetical protein
MNPNSTYGDPFWSPGGNTRIFFTMTFALDELYAAIATKIKHRHPTTTMTASTNDLTQVRQ